MRIDSFLFKNDKLYQKYLNINALYDKNIKEFEFLEGDCQIIAQILKDKIRYIRKNVDYVFELVVSKSFASCMLHLNNFSSTLKIKVLNSEYQVTEKEIVIKYALESEEKVLNKIILKLEDEI